MLDVTETHRVCSSVLIPVPVPFTCSYPRFPLRPAPPAPSNLAFLLRAWSSRVYCNRYQCQCMRVSRVQKLVRFKVNTGVFTEIAAARRRHATVAKTDLAFELVLCNKIRCTSDEIRFECNITRTHTRAHAYAYPHVHTHTHPHTHTKQPIKRKSKKCIDL